MIKKVRNSSIELLKILGIFSIIVSHVVQTIATKKYFAEGDGSYINIASASSDMNIIVLNALRCLGAFGNSIFFLCTAWFLISSKGFNVKKWLSLIVNSWVISNCILVAAIIAGIRPEANDIIKSIFLISLSTNWYLSCYVIFYLLHPLLNVVIKNIPRKTHLLAAVSLSFLYVGLNCVKSDLLYGTKLATWIAIYFDIAYLKIYVPKLIDKKSSNVIFCAIGFLGLTGLLLITNYLGLHIGALSDKMQHWAVISNPFILMLAFGIFNLVRQKEFVSSSINLVASVSLYLYLTHENHIFRTYCRPRLVSWLRENLRFGYPYITILVLSVGLFFGSLAISIVYAKTLQKVIDKTIFVFYDAITKKIESKNTNSG